MAGREHIFQEAMNQGHSAAWDQDWQRAASFYRKALEEFPEHPKALTSLALALYQLGEYEESLSYYQRAVKVSPDDPAPLVKSGEIFERLGKIKEAAQAYSRAGDLYLRLRDVERTVDTWTRALALQPALLQTRYRLAQVYEKLRQPDKAATEYIAAAAVLQHAGRKEQALQVLQRARQIAPSNPRVQQALSMLNNNRPLPLPRRRGVTAPLLKARVEAAHSEQPAAQEMDSTLDPITEARKAALSALADMLFEQQAEASQEERRASLIALTHGTGQLDQERIRRTQIMLHISHAIDLITRGELEQAIPDLSQAISAGLDHPAAYFVLGELQFKAGRLESAQRNLHHAVRHREVGLAARLLRGQIALQQERWRDAVVECLEALKAADVTVAPPELADELRQLYEPIIEEQSQSEDEAAQRKLAENILELIVRPDWRRHLRDTRKQLMVTTGQETVPLVEMLTEARSSRVVEHIATILQLARQGRLRSAMEEAYYALQFAPTYLPLHTTMADLLIQQEHLEDAIVKMKTVARTYNVRGEAVQAIRLLRRVVELAPMDMEAHQELLSLLTARGQVDEALGEYLNLADAYYRLAELDTARQTYEQALRLAQQSHADRAWSVQILHRMADIDMQRLNWRKALRVYNQIATLQPDDPLANQRLVELNFRMGAPQVAMQALEHYLRYLQERGETEHAVTFLQELVDTLPEEPLLLLRLGEVYRLAGQREQAVEMLDRAGELFLSRGDRESAVQTIQTIIELNPPNADQYRQLLDQI